MADPTNLKKPELSFDVKDAKDDDGNVQHTSIFAGLNDDMSTKLETGSLLGRAYPGDGPMHVIKLGPGLMFTLDPANGVGKLEVDVPAMKDLLGLPP